MLLAAVQPLEDDPDKPFFSTAEDEVSANPASSDLPAYDLRDDESDLNPVKVPIYLRECVNGLRASDDVNALEGALLITEKLVRSQPADLGTALFI